MVRRVPVYDVAPLRNDIPVRSGPNRGFDRDEVVLRKRSNLRVCEGNCPRE